MKTPKSTNLRHLKNEDTNMQQKRDLKTKNKDT